MTEFSRIKGLLLQGYAVEWKQLSLCCIADYYNGPLVDNGAFQVHCDHYKTGMVSELEPDVDKAVIRFLELKRKCYGRKN